MNNQERYTVLVTGTSSYGVGEGLLKVIDRSKYRGSIRLIGASNSNLTAYKNIIDEYYVLPNAFDNQYLDNLLVILKKEYVDILIPGSEAEMEVLAKNKDVFEGITDIWVNDYQIIEIFNNKQKTNIFLNKSGLIIPKIFKNHNKIKFPVITKPIYGKSSEGIYVINNNKQLEAVENIYSVYNVEYIIQEYLNNGIEYTVSMINIDKDSQEILIMKRILNKGATQFAEYVEDSIIKELCYRLHDIIKEYLVLNIQLIEKDNNFYIIEINPRFSGSSPMRALMGFNEFDIIFSKKYLKSKLNYTINENKFVVRGYIEY